MSSEYISQKVKLSDILTLKYGKVFNGLSSGEIPVYGSGGVINSVNIALYEKPSILIPRVGSIHNLFYVDQPFWHNNTIFRSEIDETKVHPLYLFYRLKSMNLENYNAGSAVPRLSASILHNIEIDLPSLAVQRSIANAIQPLDGKIAINNAINNKLEEIASAVYRAWFVDYLPFGGVKPADWEEGKLNQIAKVEMGQSPVGTSYNDSGDGVVFYQGAGQFQTRFPKRKSYTTQPNKIAEKGDILLSVRAPVGLLNIAGERCCIGRGLAAIKPLPDHHSFVFYALKNADQIWSSANAEGTIFGAINKQRIENIDFTIPSKAHLEQYKTLAEPFEKMISTISEEIDKLILIRDELLPRVLSGKLGSSSIYDLDETEG